MDKEKLVIAGDRETGEAYLARIVDGDAHGHDPPPRPIVLILRAVRYPNQRAFAHADRAVELPALSAGIMCRMEILRDAADEEAALLALPEGEALGRAIRRAISETDSDEEKDILRRHAEGDVRRGRVVLKFHPSDIAYLKKYSGKCEAHGIPEDMDELPGGH